MLLAMMLSIKSKLAAERKNGPGSPSRFD